MPVKARQNVQQQNAGLKAGVKSEALYWRTHKLPEALEQCGIAHGVNWSRSIIVDLEFDFPGMAPLSGLLLTQDEQFIDFAIDTDPTFSQVVAIEYWQNVTHKQNLSEHNRGTGIGRGALCIQVLHALNETAKEI